MLGPDRVEVFAIAGRVLIRNRFTIAKSLGSGCVVNTPVGVNLSQSAVLPHRGQGLVDVSEQIFVALANADAEGHTRGRNFHTSNLRPSGVIRSDRCVHYESVQPGQSQIDKLLNLSVVAS